VQKKRLHFEIFLTFISFYLLLSDVERALYSFTHSMRDARVITNNKIEYDVKDRKRTKERKEEKVYIRTFIIIPHSSFFR